MANFDAIKTAIDANIKTNGTQDITGGKMNSILHQMVDATGEQLTELESEVGKHIKLTELERIDSTSINKNGVISTNQYVLMGTVFSFSLKKNRIYKISATYPGFNTDYRIIALYKNDVFVQSIGICNNTTEDVFFILDTQYIDADLMRVCTYKPALDRFAVWESVDVTRSDVPIDSVVGFADYKNNILQIPSIESKAVKSVNFVDSLNSQNGILNVEYTTELSRTYNDAIIGETLSFEPSNYRNLICADVRGLNGLLTVTNSLSTSALNGLILTDSNNVVLATTIVNDSSNYRDSYINLNLYPTCAKVYTLASNASDARKVSISLLSKYSVVENAKDVFRAINLVNGCHYELRSARYVYYALEAAEVGQKYELTENIYRSVYIIPVCEVAGCKIRVQNVNPINTQGILIINGEDEVLGVIDATPNIPNTLIVDLSSYSNAEYLIFSASSSSDSTYAPTFNVVENNYNASSVVDDMVSVPQHEVTYVSTDYTSPSGELEIGDTYQQVSTPYRSVVEIDVRGLRGKLSVRNVLGGMDKRNVCVVDANNIVLDILSGSTSSSYTCDVVVDLEKYESKAVKVYAKAAPLNNTWFGQPIVYNYYEGIKDRLSDIENDLPKGVVILHFDVNPYGQDSFNILKEYGFPCSWAMEDSAFGDGSDNTFSTWRSEEHKNIVMEALKRGDDVGIYPSEIASRYDEDGWKNWLDTVLTNLGKHGIFNVSAFFTGRLDINNDLLNAVKSRGFKFIRGGGAGDAQSVDTYTYTEANKFMPIKPTQDTFFVNSTVFIGNNSDVEWFEGIVNKTIDNHAAISVFTHSVKPNDTDSLNMSSEKFRLFMDVLKAKVDAGQLKVMSWKDYYRTINRIDGESWDYNRLLKMVMSK